MRMSSLLHCNPFIPADKNICEDSADPDEAYVKLRVAAEQNYK